MTDQRNARFQEYQNRINQVLQKSAGDPATNLAWLFEELLYEQKNKHIRVSYKVYQDIRYRAQKRTLKEFSLKYGLPMHLVKKIVYGLYFAYK